MRAYYNKRTDTITMIPEGQRIDFRVYYQEDLPKEKRAEMKALLLYHIINHPHILFMHPKARRRGHRYMFASSGLIQADVLPTDFIEHFGMSLVVAKATVGDMHFSSVGDTLLTSTLNSCIRKAAIDEMLETL